ncbi:hypothetical protein STVA_34150 [Allostella vacuolata]|nr:hypothetical protein STVA_34150 [Stella vacuolata]
MVGLNHFTEASTVTVGPPIGADDEAGKRGAADDDDGYGERGAG